jgi:hypothetical protein
MAADEAWVWLIAILAVWCVLGALLCLNCSSMPMTDPFRIHARRDFQKCATAPRQPRPGRAQQTGKRRRLLGADLFGGQRHDGEFVMRIGCISDGGSDVSYTCLSLSLKARREGGGSATRLVATLPLRHSVFRSFSDRSSSPPIALPLLLHRSLSASVRQMGKGVGPARDAVRLL